MGSDDRQGERQCSVFEPVAILSPPLCGGIAPFRIKSATEMKDNTFTSPIYQPCISKDQSILSGSLSTASALLISGHHCST